MTDEYYNVPRTQNKILSITPDTDKYYEDMDMCYDWRRGVWWRCVGRLAW